MDAGSCNGCEIEIAGAFTPVYDAESCGARLVASPRHADAALVSGRNMAEPLRRTVAAMPEPRLVVAVGDCAIDCEEFNSSQLRQPLLPHPRRSQQPAHGRNLQAGPGRSAAKEAYGQPLRERSGRPPTGPIRSFTDARVVA